MCLHAETEACERLNPNRANWHNLHRRSVGRWCVWIRGNWLLLVRRSFLGMGRLRRDGEGSGQDGSACKRGASWQPRAWWRGMVHAAVNLQRVGFLRQLRDPPIRAARHAHDPSRPQRATSVAVARTRVPDPGAAVPSVAANPGTGRRSAMVVPIPCVVSTEIDPP